MIVGVGIDLIANDRFDRELAAGEWTVADGVFTSREIHRCRRGRRPALCYAACFAAKEATLKALGIGVFDLGALREVELELDQQGRCGVALHGRIQSALEHLGARNVRVSIASGKSHTGAMAILES